MSSFVEVNIKDEDGKTVVIDDLFTIDLNGQTAMMDIERAQRVKDAGYLAADEPSNPLTMMDVYGVSDIE